jgi:hypothetical protein
VAVTRANGTSEPQVVDDRGQDPCAGGELEIRAARLRAIASKLAALPGSAPSDEVTGAPERKTARPG